MACSPVGRFANYHLLTLYEPAHPKGSWAAQHPTNHRHIMLIRLQVKGLRSQDGHRTAWQYRHCPHPSCLAIPLFDDLTHAMCVCPRTATQRQHRDSELNKILDQIPLLPPAVAVPRTPRPAHDPEWTAMLLGAPLHMFSRVRTQVASRPRPQGSLELQALHLRFLRVVDSYIQQCIPRHRRT